MQACDFRLGARGRQLSIGALPGSCMLAPHPNSGWRAVGRNTWQCITTGECGNGVGLYMIELGLVGAPDAKEPFEIFGDTPTTS